MDRIAHRTLPDLADEGRRAKRSGARRTEPGQLRQGPDGSLGTLTKSRSALRAERYALQATARGILPGERVSTCLRRRRSKDSSVTVWRAVDSGAAHFKGLMACGSVWHCPVCAARISERRRVELEGAIAVHQASGGSVILVTVTNSHDRSDKLADLLTGQEKALHRFRSDRASKAIWSSFGVIGMVRALEVTHGRNGWHPHYHFLVFLDGLVPARRLKDLQVVLAHRWIDCCAAAGLPLPSLERGVDVRGGEWAARYASKWGLEQEMTKSHIKRGKQGGRTPFDLLREAFDTGEYAVCKLFREYAECFKGKRQLVWSPGLKDRLGVQEISDQAIAENADQESILLGTLSVDEWRLILRWDLRANILEAAERGWPDVLEILRHCRMARLEEAQSG